MIVNFLGENLRKFSFNSHKRNKLFICYQSIIIFPLLTVQISKFKAQSLKFQNLSPLKKNRNALVAEVRIYIKYITFAF